MISSSKIYLQDLRVRAYHGVLEQERRVGNDYVLNIQVQYPVENACLSDNVEDTLNYALLAEIAKKEMAEPSSLLEHVARRIGAAIFSQFPLAEGVTIDIKKVAPPMSCDCSGAGVTLTMLP